MKTYETVSSPGTTPRATDRIAALVASWHARRGMRLSRRRALILGAGLWVGLFSLTMVVLPPWGAPAQPAVRAPRRGTRCRTTCSAPRVAPRSTLLYSVCHTVADGGRTRRIQGPFNDCSMLAPLFVQDWALP